MSCLSPEMLASIALELDDVERPSHLDECPACQEKLADLRRLTGDLTAAHANLGRNHTASRDRLLARLSGITRPAPPAVAWKRFAFGGLGLSSAVAALLLLAVFANSSSQLSATERIVKAVRSVGSFSYKYSYRKDNPTTAKKPGRTLDCNNYIYWQAPQAEKRDQFGDFRAAMKNVAVYHGPTSDQKPVVLTDLVEIHPSGERGILIDYIAKKFFRVPPLHAEDIVNTQPLLWLRAVRERAGKIVDDLGTREVNGRETRGYTMTFDDVLPVDEFGPVEVWIDPETSLPVEFFFRNAKAEGYTDKYSVTDIQWNLELDPKLFDTTPPAGFLDVTLPTDEHAIAEIIAALKLYAQLNGGHYPQAAPISADSIRDEVLKLGGFVGPQEDAWSHNETYEQIQRVQPGFETLERILQGYKWLIGYNGSEVTVGDKNKVLLWWNVARASAKDEQYQIFYGDLRTEVVPRKKWLQFVPPEIAELTE